MCPRNGEDYNNGIMNFSNEKWQTTWNKMWVHFGIWKFNRNEYPGVQI